MCLYIAVWSRRLSHWTSWTTFHHHGGKATHQQHPGVHYTVCVLTTHSTDTPLWVFYEVNQLFYWKYYVVCLFYLTTAKTGLYKQTRVQFTKLKWLLSWNWIVHCCKDNSYHQCRFRFIWQQGSAEPANYNLPAWRNALKCCIRWFCTLIVVECVQYSKPH